MPEIGPSGSEGGVAQTNAPFLPLSDWVCVIHPPARWDSEPYLNAMRQSVLW
jgi:hypothetical protein